MSVNEEKHVTKKVTLLNIDCMEYMATQPDDAFDLAIVDDMQVGKAGEYLVCADLIMRGYTAYPSEQGLPYDVVLDINGALYKVQVKATRTHKETPQRKTSIPIYQFNIGRNGKGGKRSFYDDGAINLFAVVALDQGHIGYISPKNAVSTMNFRVPKYRGKYHDEQSEILKASVMKLKNNGVSCQSIADKLNMKLSNVYKYSANVSIAQKGTNSGIYIDELSLERALND